jgi:hypothetical protein
LTIGIAFGAGKRKRKMDNEFSFRTAMIANADGADVSLQNTDHSTRGVADTEVLFRNLTEKLIEQINAADAVFGCVAWLTSIPVLDALATKKAVGIVVQKEDFLRPDSGDWRQKRQREAYALPGFIRYSLGQTGHYDYASTPESDAVRCVGEGPWSTMSLPTKHISRMQLGPARSTSLTMHRIH